MRGAISDDRPYRVHVAIHVPTIPCLIEQANQKPRLGYAYECLEERGFIGVAFGFTIPIFLNSIQMLGHWPVRPSAYFLFRPRLILLVPVAIFLHRQRD